MIKKIIKVLGMMVVWSQMLYAQTVLMGQTLAGEVIVTAGQVKAVRFDQTTHVLRRGDYFYVGDVLSTGKNSNLQVRFTDNTVLALTENSVFKINRYLYQKKSDRDSSVVTLLKGGLRAVTGLISKANPDAYQVQTPVAVIGVRGTNYGLTLDPEGQLYAGVWKGRIFLQNNAGLIVLGEKEDYHFALIRNKNVLPIGLLNPPPQLTGQC